MVHKTPMKNKQRRGVTRGPRLELGLDGGLAGERLVAGSATGPGRAQPKKAMWHPSLFFNPWAHHLWEDLFGSGTWVAVKVVGLNGPDLGGKSWLWGHGPSPRCGERNRSL